MSETTVTMAEQPAGKPAKAPKKKAEKPKEEKK